MEKHYAIKRTNSDITHHGIKGMKWGVRRFQNKDGSLKPAGEKRYTTIREASKKARADGVTARKVARESGQLSGIGAVRKGNKIQREAAKASMKEIKKQNKQAKENSQSTEQVGEKKGLSDKQKKAIKVGAAVAGTALAAYGAYKVSQMMKNKAAEHSYKTGKQIADKYLKEAVSLKIDDYGIVSPKNTSDVNAMNLRKYRAAMKYTDDRTKKVSSSTVEAYKYLRNKDGRANISVGADLNGIYAKGHYGDIRK